MHIDNVQLTSMSREHGPPMALAHFSAQFIPATRSPVAAAAYRHRTTMLDTTTGETYSYTRVHDLAFAEVALPLDSPPWIHNLLAQATTALKSQALWNEVLIQENQLHGQSAREIVIALPLELSLAQNIALMREFIATEFTAKGLIADWVVHNKPGNPHVHIMHTLRAIEATRFGRKRLPLLDAVGAILKHNNKRVYRPVIGTRADFTAARSNWGATATRHLQAAGFDQTVDMSSYASRGLDLTPTTHRGPTVNALVVKQRPSVIADLQALDTDEAAAQLLARPSLVLDIITSQTSTFGTREIAKIAHRFSNDTATYELITAAVLASPELKPLRLTLTDSTTGRTTARAVYTTVALHDIESRMAETAARLTQSDRPGVAPALVAAAIASEQASVGFAFSAEQIAALQHVTATSDIACVIGVAGTGKSTMLAVARRAWEADGRRVLGGALAGKAADALTGSSGIPSRTLASWEANWAAGRQPLRRGDVFVLDEAGMVASPQLARFLDVVAEAGAKLVLVGDPEQLQPIEAGAAFRAITERTGHVALTDVRRQSLDWQRRATQDLSSGRTRAALAAYRDAGCVVAPLTRGDAITAIVEAYVARRSGNRAASQMVLAHSNASVYDLNCAIRTAIAADLGVATTFATVTGSREFACGDRIIFLENKTFTFAGAPHLGPQRVQNGALGSITAVASGSLTVALDTGQTVMFDQATYTNVDHGYAATVHKNQGVTVDHAYVLASPSMERHLAYVALSRHRHSVTLYAPVDDFYRQSLDDCLSRSAGKTTSLDFADDFAARRGWQTIGQIAAAAYAVIADQRQRLAAVAARLIAQARSVARTALLLKSLGLPPLSHDLSTTLYAALSQPFGAHATSDPVAKSIAPPRADDITAYNVAINAQLADKLVWSQPNEAVTVRAHDELPDPERARLRAALPSLLALRQLSRFVPRTSPAARPDTSVAGAVNPEGLRRMDAQSQPTLVYDQAARTISYPYNPEANRAMADVATWNKDAKHYAINPGTTPDAIDKAISQAEQALAKAAGLATRGAELVEQLKPQHPDFRLQSKDGRMSFSIPPRMESATVAAKQMGAVYSQTKTDKTRWSLPLDNISNERLNRGLQNVANAINEAQRSTSIAGAIAAAGHPDDRINLSNAADTLYVRSPNLPSANNELKAVGFKWDDEAGAYAIKIDATVDPKQITARLSAASQAYDTALVPPTAERAGIDHPPWRVADALKLDADALRNAFEADPKLAKSAQIYASQLERAAPGLRDDLKSGQFEPVATKLGITVDLAAAIATMHKQLDSALTPAAPAQVQQQTQVQSMGM
jgi:Ti-type conjugative transfer relaxase TraA